MHNEIKAAKNSLLLEIETIFAHISFLEAHFSSYSSSNVTTVAATETRQNYFVKTYDNKICIVGKYK
jgi:hypothetical protein